MLGYMSFNLFLLSNVAFLQSGHSTLRTPVLCWPILLLVFIVLKIIFTVLHNMFTFVFQGCILQWWTPLTICTNSSVKISINRKVHPNNIKKLFLDNYRAEACVVGETRQTLLTRQGAIKKCGSLPLNLKISDNVIHLLEKSVNGNWKIKKIKWCVNILRFLSKYVSAWNRTTCIISTISFLVLMDSYLSARA